MNKTKFDVGRAIASLERKENLREAELNGQWVIHKPRLKRVRSTSEREPKRMIDSASCLHDVSYTMACKHCRRSNEDAKANRASIARKLLNLNKI